MSLVQPTITDWLQGIGTTAGTIFAAVAAFAAIMLFRHEIKVRRHDEADKQAAQARSVFVTFEEVTSADPQVGGLILPRDDDKLVASVDIYIHNLSDAVIADTSWKATRTDTNDVILRMSHDILGPGERAACVVPSILLNSGAWKLILQTFSDSTCNSLMLGAYDGGA
jgi:hypothetical protein